MANEHPKPRMESKDSSNKMLQCKWPPWLEDHQSPSTFIGSWDKEYQLIKGKRQGKDSLHLIGQGKEAPLGVS